MKNSECKLKMLELYFSKFDFSCESTSEKTDKSYKTSFKIGYAVNKQNDAVLKVCIDTLVEDEESLIKLNLQTIGVFEVDKTDLDDDTYAHLIKLNTVAIMLPYIRSQVSLLTTQPGMLPVMIPPIDVNNLLSKEVKNDIDD